MFGKGLNSPGTVYDKRIGIVEWNSRYPLLLPSFVKLLDNANVSHVRKFCAWGLITDVLVWVVKQRYR